ncbi:MAG: hypothetical protein K6D57_04410 [Paludibacteraceae bacterium]|jgi:glutamine synthetase type III|nr:hypothetical protein [Paludibacteraceae bacterium]MCR5298521.1 hypothetical protein [Paludibacteraceae bacterium]
MTDSDLQLLNELTAQINRLKELYEAEVSKNGALIDTVSNQTRKVERLEKELLEWKVKCNHLTDAAMLSVTEEQRQESKKRLNQMMREIERCLTLLR